LKSLRTFEVKLLCMNLNEIIFFFLFISIIFGVLWLDLSVIGKKNHILPFKEALGWTLLWVFLGLLFFLFIKTHGDLIHGRDSNKDGIVNVDDLRQLQIRYDHPINFDGLNYEEALKVYRHNMSLEYITGYLLEYALSVDNVFVMILIFLSFGVKEIYYKRVLFWGIIGAIIMRFIFIFLSATLIHKFSWILYVFGGFLVFTGIQMFIERNKKAKIDTDNHPAVKFVSKYFSVYKGDSGKKFWLRENSKFYFTPLFIVLLVIEFSDVIFAFDSVPAIFSVTQDPYVVFFSNIFAILGLRSLFFLVVHVIHLFEYLKIGLSVLLVFIGTKMFLHNWLEEIGFTTAHSLYIILLILSLSIIASLLFPSKEKNRVEI